MNDNRVNDNRENLRIITSEAFEYLGITKNGEFVNQSDITLLSGLIMSDDYSEDYSNSTKNLYIDKREQAYSVAFFGFSSQGSRVFQTDTFGARINDSITYSHMVRLIAGNTENKNIFKYEINQEEWLLSKLQELNMEQDQDKKSAMLMQLPEVIITPSNVKFSDEVTQLLCDYNIPVQRVGMEKQEDSLDLGDVVKYNYDTGMQELNKQSTFQNSMKQINTQIANEKMRKQRGIQKRKIAEIEERTIGMQSEEAVDYILSHVEDMYRDFDIDTYNHIQVMKQLVSTLDLGLPEGKKLSDVERENLERMVILHDVGKLCVPKQVVASTQGLNDYERNIMNQHVSVDNVAMFNNETVNELLNYALNHHMGLDLEAHKDTSHSNSKQMMDVSAVGYGDKRVAEYSNDKLVQMLHVIDVYNALRADRSYKNGFSMEKTVSIMQEDVANGKMNPEYVQCLLNGVELENQKGKSA